jgi:hypothetical protein
MVKAHFVNVDINGTPIQIPVGIESNQGKYEIVGIISGISILILLAFITKGIENMGVRGYRRSGLAQRFDNMM